MNGLDAMFIEGIADIPHLLLSRVPRITCFHSLGCTRGRGRGTVWWHYRIIRCVRGLDSAGLVRPLNDSLRALLQLEILNEVAQVALVERQEVLGRAAADVDHGAPGWQHQLVLLRRPV